MFPSNEAETILFFKLIQSHIGLKLVHLQTAFPDAVVESEDGTQLTVEFEYLAKNFLDHNHDPLGCDAIICYRNNWNGAPLPVIALNECARKELDLVRRILRTRHPAPDLEAAADKIHDLQVSLRRGETEIKELRRVLGQKEEEVTRLQSELNTAPDDSPQHDIEPTKAFLGLAMPGDQNERVFIGQFASLVFVALFYLVAKLVGLLL